MCIAIVESHAFSDKLNVRFKNSVQPLGGAISAKHQVLSLVHAQGEWHGGRIRWGFPTVIQGRKKWLRHAKVERRRSPFWKGWQPLLIPVQAFIERNTLSGVSAFARFTADTPFWIGGLWAKDDEEVASLVMLTQPADSTVSPFHHRMPVSMDFNGAQHWIDTGHVPDTSILLQANPMDHFE